MTLLYSFRRVPAGLGQEAYNSTAQSAQATKLTTIAMIMRGRDKNAAATFDGRTVRLRAITRCRWNLASCKARDKNNRRSQHA
jgi:hypothetical protein